jgi:hypothetical protein
VAISHVKSNTNTDFAGTITVFNSAGVSTTMAGSDNVRPSDWNSVHQELATITGNTAGVSTFLGTNLVLAGGNNVTLNMSTAGSGGTLSIVAGGGNQLSLGGNTTGTLALISSGTALFAGGNNITLSQSGNSITISAANTGTATQSNQSVGLYASGNTTGVSSSTTVDARSLTVYGSGIISVGMSAGSLIVSAPAPATLNPLSAGMSTGGNTAGTTGIASNQLVLAGGANVTLSGSTNAGSMTISIAAGGGGGGGGVALANSQTTYSSGTVALSAGGGAITIGSQTGNAFTISVPATSSMSATGFMSISTNGSTVSIGAGPLSWYALGNTTQSSSGTLDGRSLSINGVGGVSVGISNGSIVLSGGGGPFASAGVSTGGNTAGATGLVASSLVFVGGNNITLSQTTGAGGAGTISIIGGAGGGGGVALSAGTQSVSTGTVAFSNSNNVSFGMSGSNVVTASASFNQSNQTLGWYAVNQTTGQSSSTTMDARSLSMTLGGALSGGFSGSSILLSAPQTSSLVGVNGITLSTNGSTISVSYLPVQTRLIIPVGNQLQAISAPGLGTMSIQYALVDQNVLASRMDALVEWQAASSATAATMGIAVSAWAGIYTKTGSTLSSVSSGSTQTTYTYASNSAGQTQLLTNAIRPMSVPININMTPGEYFLGFNFSTAATSIGTATTSLGQTLLMIGGSLIQTSVNYAEFTAQTASSTNLYGGMGVYTAVTAGLPGAVSLFAIAQTGASLSQANIALVMRNQ